MNVNYGLELSYNGSGQSPAAVAAKLVVGALDFKGLLDRCAFAASATTTLSCRWVPLTPPLALHEAQLLSKDCPTLCTVSTQTVFFSSKGEHPRVGCGGGVLACHSEVLTPDSTKDGPLCMNQFARLFGHARIPRAGRDELVRVLAQGTQ